MIELLFIIGLALDDTCLNLQENNLTNNCPTYEQINLLYPSLECNYSGYGCLEYFRQLGINNGYIIDPNTAIMERIKMITFRSNFEEYKLPTIGGGYNTTEHSLTVGINRHVSKCSDAYIDAGAFIELTGDTIMYLNSNCTLTNYDNKKTTQFNKVDHNIETSYKWQLEKWVNESKEKCLTICKEY